MNNNNIKNENKKAIPKYLITVIICAVLGGFVGMYSVHLKSVELKEFIAGFVQLFILNAVPYSFIFGALVFILPAAILYSNIKKRYLACGDEDDEILDKLDNKLNLGLSLVSVCLVFCFLNLSFIFGYIDNIKLSLLILSFLTYVSDLGLIVFIQQKYVDFMKQINPQKKGSVYEFKFQQKWLDSCDEAEKKLIGQAAYYSMSLTSKCTIVIWALLLFMDIIFDTGIFPMVVVIIILGISQISYMYKSMKLLGKSR